MLRELRVQNLKSFAGEHRAHLAPLTLIYGPNSGGKSTLLQALLFAAQTADAGGLMIQPRFQGARTDLGNFHLAVHGHDTNRVIKLGFSWGDSEEPRRLDVGWGAVVDGERVTPVLDRWEASHSKSSTGPGALVAQADASELPEQPQAMSETVSVALSSAGGESPEEGGGVEIIHPVLRALGAGASKLVRLWQGRFQVKEGDDDEWQEVGENSDLASAYSLFRNGLEPLLGSIQHIGPIRNPVTRGLQLEPAAVATVGGAGENTGALLGYSVDLEPFNKLLHDFGIEYEVHSMTVQHPLLGSAPAVYLVDRLGVPSGIEDVGYGVSQVLPVLLSLSLLDGQTLLLQQPELHLHPRLQASLADVIVRSLFPLATEDGKETRRLAAGQVIIETHSEALIRRIQRRIRLGFDDEPEGCRLDPHDVAVLYVHKPRGTSEIKRLDLDEDGDFLESWPGGFFDERLTDLF